MYERTMTVLLVAGLAACSSSPAAPQCAPGLVQGGVDGVSVPVFDDEGGLTGFRIDGATIDGALAGTASADLVIVGFDEDGTIRFTGSHEFLDPGDAFLFRTSDEGITTATGQVENEMTVVEGGSGDLTTTGTVDLNTGTLELQYQGEVCL